MKIIEEDGRFVVRNARGAAFAFWVDHDSSCFSSRGDHATFNSKEKAEVVVYELKQRAKTKRAQMEDEKRRDA